MSMVTPAASRAPLVSALGLILVLLHASPAASADDSMQLHMRDGQLTARLVRVEVVNGKLANRKSLLRLCLYETKPADENNKGPCANGPGYPVFVIADDQQWVETVDGNQIARSGTVILFDLSDFEFGWWNPSQRVLPVLQWTLKDEHGREVPRKLMSSEAVLLASRSGVLTWAVGSVGFVVLLVWALIGKRDGLLLLLATKDGRLSMSLTQMALWTLAVGGATIALAVSRLDVPEMPETLLLLMGLSVGTSGVGHWQASRLQVATGAAAHPKNPTPRFRDLIAIPGASNSAPSLAKAQLLLWTVFTLAMFVSKSAVHGVLWEVPMNLVLLMGISQAGFLARKELANSEAAKPVPAVAAPNPAPAPVATP